MDTWDEETDEVYRHLRRARNHLNRVDELLDRQIVPRLWTAESRVEELEREWESLRTENAGLRAELVSMQQGVSTADELKHQSVANRFDAFVAQDVENLVPLLQGRGGDGEERRLARAELVSHALATLLVLQEFAPERLLEEGGISPDDPEIQQFLPIVEDVCRRGRALVDDAAVAARPGVWVSDIDRADDVDGSWLVWPGCDPGAAFDFVVVPEYRCGEKVYRRALVFTSPSDPTPDPPTKPQPEVSATSPPESRSAPSSGPPSGQRDASSTDERVERTGRGGRRRRT